MIEASELRIGNWVTAIQCDGSEVQQKIDVINAIGNFATTTHGWSKIKPIPLTEEWLLKFGFEENTTSWTNYKTRPCVKIGKQGKYLYYNGGSRIVYVHQLQNLYFALTSEELTIKINEK
tara:strand:- start:203 stop:562 length:360 start_codon:yes stop_codon:yes gene_type:complete